MIEMVKHKSDVKKGEVVPPAGSLEQDKKVEKKEEHFCKDCRFYDKSRERPMKRDKIRVGLVETRAPCMNEKSTAYRHRVMNTSKNKPCWTEGVFIPPAKVEEKKKPGRKKKPTPEPEQNKGPMPEPKEEQPGRGKKNRNTSEVATNPLTGESQVLEVRDNGKTFVKKG